MKSYEELLGNVLTAAGQQAPEAFVDAILSEVEDLTKTQTTENTTLIYRYMFYSHSPIEERIGAVLKNLERGDRFPQEPKDTGVKFGFYSVNNSKQLVGHIVIGIPNLYGVYITVVHDKELGTKSIHGVWGTYTKVDYGAIGVKHGQQTQRVVSLSEILKIVTLLDKLGKGENPNEVKVDPDKTLEAAQARYEQRWGKQGTMYQPWPAGPIPTGLLDQGEG